MNAMENLKIKRGRKYAIIKLVNNCYLNLLFSDIINVDTEIMIYSDKIIVKHIKVKNSEVNIYYHQNIMKIGFDNIGLIDNCNHGQRWRLSYSVKILQNWKIVKSIVKLYIKEYNELLNEIKKTNECSGRK